MSLKKENFFSVIFFCVVTPPVSLGIIFYSTGMQRRYLDAKKLHACSELVLVKGSVIRLAKASGLGVGIFWVVVFSSGGVASSALGLRPFTLLLDRMLLRMSIRLS